MKMFLRLLWITLLGFSAALQYVHKDNALLDMRDDFVRRDASNENAMHEVVFAVKQKNLGEIEQILFEVSDPSNAKYGKYLTREQVGALTENRDGTYSIQQFLASHGATVVHTTPYGEYITAMAPIALWQKLFATTFYDFEHVEKSTKVQRCVHYSLPLDIADHVEAVFNTVQLPPRKALRTLVSQPMNSTASGSVTPALLNSYYHITSNVGNSLASQSLFESLEQYYSPNDLTTFQNNYGLPVEAVANDIGGYVSDSECVDDANNCAEANLDVQYIMAVSQATPTTYWYDGSSDSFLSWIRDVAATANPPLVHSISYGAIEPELPKSTSNAFNTEAMKLGTQGVTILVSSGDDGVANFQARTNPKKCGYNPSFPASSPYVTAVGATQGPESGTTEIACTSDAGGVITTGGGFSTIFSAPSYQTGTISSYFSGLTSSQQPATGYAASGRGYPDVAMAGYNYEVVIGGKTYALSGTSASSPVVAGMVSLVNAARLKAGKSALGFLNTAIYKYGTQLTNDVTSGKNNCAASKVCCDQGFYATAGWDPLTGFGSVDFTKFANIFNNL